MSDILNAYDAWVEHIPFDDRCIYSEQGVELNRWSFVAKMSKEIPVLATTA